MKSLQLLLFLSLHSYLSLSLESPDDARWSEQSRDCSSSADFTPPPNLAGAIGTAMGDLIGRTIRSPERAAWLSEECAAAWQKLWATQDEGSDSGISLGLRAIDSFGKIGAGIMDGNVYAHGSYDECRSIGRGDMEVQFCLVPVDVYRHLNGKSVNRSRLLQFDVGMCWPQECGLSDMEAGLFLTGLQLNQFLPGGELELKMNQAEAYCSAGRPAINAGATVMIVICSVICMVVMVSTCLDWLFSRWNSNKTTPNPQLNFSASSDSARSETTPLTGKPEREREPILKVLVTAFSLSKSVKAVFSTAQPANAIKCVNGLRVLSMGWVIACATLLWTYELQHSGMDNGIMVLNKVAPQFANQVINNGLVAVDSFFLIGGFLSSYLTLDRMASGTHQWRVFLRYYSHRFFRLAPTYVFVLLFYWFLTMHLADGPVYELNTGENSVAYSNCQKYWWTNILFINNLYPWKLKDECMKWSWYLANDVQFYILAPLVFVPLYWLWPVGLIIAGTVTCGSLVSSGLAAGLYELDANIIVHSALHSAAPGPSESQAIDELVKPYTRVAPYVVGILLGYVIFRKSKLPFNKLPNRAAHVGLWVAAILFCSLVLFGLYSTWQGRSFTATENILYFSFSHLTWGTGVALIVFSCHNGYGGVVSRLLSMNVWVPLSRLTFGAYLLHPIVLTVALGSLHSPLHYTSTTALVYITASVCLSYTAAAVLAVFLEFPLANLEAILTRQLGLVELQSVRGGQPNMVYEDVLV